MRKFPVVIAAGLALATATAGAQVGYPPASSPFLDVEQRHAVTGFFGYFSAKRDPAAVAPKGGPMGGLQYEWRASGPLHLGMSFMTVASERTTLDPSKPIAERVVGTEKQPLFAADGFLAVSLTGERSWHHLMPVVGAGLGLITDTKNADVGGFRFGTRFAFPWSVGVRWIPGGGSLQLRADVKDWMYTIKYPQAYYTSSTSGEAAIVPTNVPASRWTNNFAMTVGGSYTFQR
ncbi:MAG TPA: hypothetical protein VFO55_14870 [Gemmatimonadaceae bacterium]|nr:hypothetical protein [Gemmatimonadaceae bacterium]